MQSSTGVKAQRDCEIRVIHAELVALETRWQALEAGVGLEDEERLDDSTGNPHHDCRLRGNRSGSKLCVYCIW